MVVGDLASLDDHVVRQDAADGLGKAAANTFVRDLEGLPGLGLARTYVGEGLLDEVESGGGGVGLEVRPRPVPLDRVGPLRDLPLEGDLGLEGRLREMDLDAVPGCLQVIGVDKSREGSRPQAGERAATGVESKVVCTVEPAGGHDPAVVAVEVALLRLRVRVLVPRVTPVDGVAERIVGHEDLLVLPVVVERVPEQDADAEVDLDEVVGDELAVNDHPGSHGHRPAPLGHVLVVEVAHRRVLEGAPAAEQHPPPADLLVPGQRLVEEVEEVVVHRHDSLHELDIAHEPDVVVGEELDGRSRADSTWVERGGVHMTALHEAEHLPRVAAHLERLAVELARKRVQRPHDVADGLVPVVAGVR